MKVAVFGAGAFGGWTALELARRGARVTLFDAWGPGNTRASSGGETRVIRATYGSHAVYTDMALDALDRWRAYEARWQQTFYRQTGALWMFGPPNDGAFGRASAEALSARGARIEELSASDAARKYPQIDFNGIAGAIFEPDAGYLLARRACEHVAKGLAAAGGQYRLGAAAAPVRLDPPRSGLPRAIPLIDGQQVEADCFVFACGPWLGTLFPDVVGDLIVPTRQEVYYFGPPAGDARFGDEQLPVWVDFRERLIYGIPGNANRGFKVADDTPGAVFDPTSGSRDPDERGIDAARRFVAERFPALAGTPLIGTEVCQYESTPDSHFIVDRHPAAADVWIAGGGSGHGFKMGPVIGDMIASCVREDAAPDPRFALRRFASPPPGGWQQKWS